MKSLFSQPLGASPLPLAFKCNPVAGAMIGSAIAGGIASLIGQSSANSANASLNRETRDWQSQENAINRNWSESMWNKENLYNTPSAQRARLEEAGYNPFIDASQGVGSTASTPNSPAMVGAPNQTPMQALPYGQAFQGVVNAALQSKAVDADVNNQNSQAIKNLGEAMPWLIKSFGKDTALDIIKSTLVGSPSDTSFIEKYIESEMKYQIGLANEQSAKAQLANIEASLKSQFGEDFAKANLSKIRNESALAAQNIEESVSRMLLNKKELDVKDAEIKELVSRSYNNIMQGQLANANAITVNQILDLVKQDLASSIQLKEIEGRKLWFEGSVLGSKWDQEKMKTEESRAKYEQRETIRSYERSDVGKLTEFCFSAVDYWFDKLGTATGAAKNVSTMP